MNLQREIQNYQPENEQERADRELMLRFMADNPDYLDRANRIAHFTASIWTVNREYTRTLMVYHNIYDSWSWIGGHADGVEDLRSVALRELKEETGAVPGKYESLGRILPSPGCYGETLHLYLARDLQMEEQHLDPDEFLNLERIPFEEMVRRCLCGEIEDAKTVAAVLKAKQLLKL